MVVLRCMQDAESLQEPEARLRAIFKAFDLRCKTPLYLLVFMPDNLV